MNTFRFSAVAGAVCAAVVCAGCSSQSAEQPAAGGSAAATGPAAAGSSPVAPATPDAPAKPTADPNVVPGSVLRTYLPNNRTLPKGWKLSSVFTEKDSGPSQVPQSAAPSPKAAPSCDQLAAHGTWIALGDPAAYANVGVVDSSAHEVGVAVNSYSAGDATSALGRLKVLEGICGSAYERSSSGQLNPVTVTVSAVDGPGEGGVLVKVDRTIYVGQEFVMMQIGDRVLSVSSDNKYGGFADVVGLAKAIAPRVK
ncbi:hypothetical protein [Streptomyces sp. NPDC002403]